MYPVEQIFTSGMSRENKHLLCELKSPSSDVQEKSHVVAGGRLHELSIVYKKGHIFHFHKIFKNGGVEGVRLNPLSPLWIHPPLMICTCTLIWLYSKTWVKRPLINRQNKDFNNIW